MKLLTLTSSFALMATLSFGQIGINDKYFNFDDNTTDEATTGYDLSINSLTKAGDEKYLITFSSYGKYRNQDVRGGVLRINPDGSIDQEFMANRGNGASFGTQKAFRDGNGKYIILGTFSNFNDNNCRGIVRLNADGSVDNTFNAGTGFASTLYGNNFNLKSIVQLSNGKYLIGGAFDSYNGQTVRNLALINSDGTLDTSFSGTEGDLNSITSLYRDGSKILVAGNLTTINGQLAAGQTGARRLVRLNMDLTIDNSFSYTHHGITNDIAKIGDEYVLVGNNLGQAQNRNILLVNSDGSINSDFNQGTGITGGAEAVVVRYTSGEGDLIYVGGTMSAYNGTAVGGIMALKRDGTLHSSSTTTAGFSGGLVRALHVDQQYNRLLAGGSFTHYDNEVRTGLASLSHCSAISPVDFDVDDEYITYQNGVLSTTSDWDSYIQWVNCDGDVPVDDARGYSFTPTVNGSYKAIHYADCIYETECITVANVGIDEVASEDFKVYPNPSNGILNITLPSVQDLTTITVYDLVGKVTFTQTVANTDQVKLSLNDAKGIYTVEVKTASSTSTKRVVIE